MAKLDWRSLVFKQEEGSEETQTKSKPQFPDSGSMFDTDVPTKTFPTSKRKVKVTKTAPSSKHLDEIVAVYERHFDALNVEGYDFYEFYEAMSGLSPRTPDAYTMAIHFAKQMGGDVNKTKLLEMADFYIGELSVLHDHNDEAGNIKLAEMINEKREEKADLEGDISEINEQIRALEQTVSSKNRELSSIDARYATQIKDVEDKLKTNTVARDSVLDSITEIKTGIEKHIN